MDACQEIKIEIEEQPHNQTRPIPITSTDISKVPAAIKRELNDNSYNESCTISQVEGNELVRGRQRLLGMTKCAHDLNQTVPLPCHSDGLHTDKIDSQKSKRGKISVALNSNLEGVSELPANESTQIIFNDHFMSQLSNDESPIHLCGQNSQEKCESSSRLNEFKCTVCPKTFLHSSSLRRHERNHTTPTCLKCNQVFSSEHHLQLHAQSHKRHVKCDVCSKGFYSSEERDEHKVIHSAAPPKCSICSKIFRATYLLERHIKTHASDRPRKYSCDICGKSFARIDVWRKHTKSHNKQFKCHICGKAFSFRDYLEVHLRMHSGKRDYKCSECDKCFTTRSVLRMHKQTHMIQGFNCANCSKTYHSKSGILFHLKHRHA